MLNNCIKKMSYYKCGGDWGEALNNTISNHDVHNIILLYCVHRV